ncbi:hypothetical protein LCGC14_0956470 [marine sediment metagenome]|uniref:Cas10/Cmr2 second palm domain-containing protein n=1 Tax=marine sediment metagenome TaxID=412755 RepID=A0A0F9QZ33_9ZZZZ|nr:hypothetical protein [archaeon]
MNKEKTLAIYDILGIQDFIFSTNKLRENLGGSIIVQNVFEKELRDLLENNGNRSLLKIKDDKIDIDNYDSILVFYRGGNALVIFDERSKAEEISKELSKSILKNSGGLLNFFVAYETRQLSSFKKDLNDLFKNLKVKKNSFIRTFPLLGISITKTELSGGLPAQFIEFRDFISLPSKKKREKALRPTEYNDLLENLPKYEFPLELDDLGQIKGQNYISVVHIDGNNMGQTIQDFLDKTIDDYSKSIYRMSLLSAKIDNLYKNVMKDLIEDITRALNVPDFRKNFEIHLNKKTKKWCLPIRPIILNGDDITFVCNGKLGINLAELFLKKLSDSKLDVGGEIIEHSASAGVAIVKSHFPFDRAYRLAEELCRSSKIKGKIIKGNERGGFWLDFHIVQSDFTSDLNEIRNTQYNIIGLSDPDSLKDSNNQMTYQQSNLLWRPWLIVGENHPKEYYWSNLKKIIQGFSSEEESWPRSKIKKFQQTLTSSKEINDLFILTIRSRDLELPNFINDHEVFYKNSRMTPYFDAIEVMDYYYTEMEDILK